MSDPEPLEHPYRPEWLQQLIDERLNEDTNEARRNT